MAFFLGGGGGAGKGEYWPFAGNILGVTFKTDYFLEVCSNCQYFLWYCKNRG